MNDIIIKETDCFGLINSDSKSYDDIDYFGNSLILLEMNKINCFVKGSIGIIGIRLSYKYRDNKDNEKEYTSIDIKTSEDCFEQEFIFKPKEKINNIIIFRKNYMQGFEITTNLKRSYRFGLDNGEKIMLNEFSSGKNIVVGFYTKFDYKIGITAIGFYYINSKQYSLFLSMGLFLLRSKLKNQKYYDSIKKINLDYENKAILETCLLPKNCFLSIMKFLID